MKYLEYRNKMDDEYFPYLRFSAYLFLIPTACLLYYKKYDLFIIIVIFSLSSILRWTYVKNKFYQLIDHTYVKLVFISGIYHVLISFVKCELTSLILLGCLMSILIFYTIGVYYDYNKNEKNIIFHMLVHLYSVFGFTLGSNHFISYYDI